MPTSNLPFHGTAVSFTARELGRERLDRDLGAAPLAVARELDRRMAAPARQFRAAYTRHADDLTFSGGPEFHRDLSAFIPPALKIIRDERFVIAREKLRVIRKGDRRKVTGIVVNRRPNVAREEVRRLRAILHDRAMKGPASQNRDRVKDFRGHLLGRIAFVRSVNPPQGDRPLAVFRRIAWSLAGSRRRLSSAERRAAPAAESRASPADRPTFRVRATPFHGFRGHGFDLMTLTPSPTDDQDCQDDDHDHDDHDGHEHENVIS